VGKLDVQVLPSPRAATMVFTESLLLVGGKRRSPALGDMIRLGPMLPAIVKLARKPG
jgi:hypothetical protein